MNTLAAKFTCPKEMLRYLPIIRAMMSKPPVLPPQLMAMPTPAAEIQEPMRTLMNMSSTNGWVKRTCAMEKKTDKMKVHIRELMQNLVPKIRQAMAIRMALKRKVVIPIGNFVAK